ncbi:MAG: hypothetical protein ABI146_07620 [Nitrobacter sp.]
MTSTLNISSAETLDMSVAKTFAPSKRYFFFMGAVSMLFLLEGILHIEKRPITSTLMILFGILGLLFAIIVLLKNSYQLELTNDGLALKFGSNQRTVPWADIKTIRVGWFDTGSAHWLRSRRLFINYGKNAKNQIMTISPVMFGVSANALVDAMLPFCKDFPRLTNAMTADCKIGGAVLRDENGLLFDA